MVCHYGLFEGEEFVGCAQTREEALEMIEDCFEGEEVRIVYDAEDDFVDWLEM